LCRRRWDKDNLESTWLPAVFTEGPAQPEPCRWIIVVRNDAEGTESFVEWPDRQTEERGSSNAKRTLHPEAETASSLYGHCKLDSRAACQHVNRGVSRVLRPLQPCAAHGWLRSRLRWPYTLCLWSANHAERPHTQWSQSRSQPDLSHVHAGFEGRVRQTFERSSGSQIHQSIVVLECLEWMKRRTKLA
jgi:hypothetical protein